MNKNFLPQSVENAKGWEPIKDPKGLHDWILRSRDRERTRYRIIWLDWIENIAAFHGMPDVRVSDDLRLVRRMSPRQIKELERYVTNFIQPHVRDLSAKAQKSRPILECIPATTDESDNQTAKTGNKFIKSEWHQQDMDLRRLEESMWKGATGNAFWHSYFDDEAGPLNFGRPIGQLATETLSPFKLILEPHRTSIERCRWSIHDQLMPMDWVQSHFGQFYQELYGKPLRITSSDSTDYQNRTGGAQNSTKEITFEMGDLLASMIGIPGRNTLVRDDDFITCCVFYHLPTAYYPRGIYAVITAREILYVGEFPHFDSEGNHLRRLPIFHFKEILSPWRLHGETGTTNVRRTQQVYIELRNLELEYLRDGLNFKWLLPKGLQIDSDKLLSRDCEAIPYNASEAQNGLKPERLRGDAPPQGIYTSYEVTVNEMNRFGGINQASQGIAPPGVDSGRALISLQEQDDTRLGQTVMLQEKEYSAWGSAQLFIAKNRYTEKRKYLVIGDGGSRGIWFFNKAELGAVTDVICQPGSSMPHNKYAKQEFVKGLFKEGILGNPQEEATRIKTRKLLEFGGYEEVFDDAGQDAAISEHEAIGMVTIARQMMAQGIMDLNIILSQAVAPVEEWDNHMVHIENTLRFWRREGIRDNPILRAVLGYHLNLHKQQLMPPQPQIGPDGKPIPGAPPMAAPPSMAQPGNLADAFNNQQIQAILAQRQNGNPVNPQEKISLNIASQGETPNLNQNLGSMDQVIKPFEGA